MVVSLPTIESSFAIHTTKSISGYQHPDYPALRVACEVLDGTESFLWVSTVYPIMLLSLISSIMDSDISGAPASHMALI